MEQAKAAAAARQSAEEENVALMAELASIGDHNIDLGGALDKAKARVHQLTTELAELHERIRKDARVAEAEAIRLAAKPLRERR